MFNFFWSDIDSYFSKGYEAAMILYNDSTFYFLVDFSLEYREFRIEYSPSFNTAQVSLTLDSWDKILPHFSSWLSCIKKEINEPDLWERLNNYNMLGNIVIDNSSESAFTYSEIMQIEQGVREVRLYLHNQVEPTDSEKIKIIDEKLDYLIESSKRMNKIDWKNIFIGNIFNILTTLALDPQVGQQIVTIFRVATSGILKLLP